MLFAAFLILITVSPTLSQPWRPVGYYDHEPIRESSGLVASRQYDGVYWTLSDSGNPADLYATGLDGKLIREISVEGATNRDWEALAIDDKGQLWIGEIGNNSRQRDDLRIYLIAEPDPHDPKASAKVIAQYPYTYTGENVDAEGMFIHQGMPYIISKERERAVLHRFTELVDGKPHTLERVGELAGGAYRITGASLNEAGTRLAAVTYDRLWIYHSTKPINIVNLIRSKPWRMPHDFGVEACAFDGDRLILTNEARSLFSLPEYVYKRGDSLPPQGTLPALSMYPDQTTSADGRASAQPFTETGIPIPGEQLLLTADSEGASVTQTLDIERDDLWEVSTIVTRGPSYGRFELLIDGNHVGSPYDCGAKEYTAGTVATFGKVHLAKGSHTFTLRMTGEGAGTKLGLDGYLIQAASPFAERFMVVGPFARATNDNIDEPLAPEQKVDLKASYTGIDGSDIYWQIADAEGNGRLNLLTSFPDAPSITQAFALTSVYSETDRDAILLVGADDQVTVWINGEKAHRNPWRGGASPDEDTVPVQLEAGWNQVLCRIGQHGGNWALYLRFNDPDGSLRYTVRPR